jgi:hypothetical protein
MGQFSWMTQDTGMQIGSEPRNTIVVHMFDDNGNIWTEKNYKGYGVFGGKDYYELVAEMNGYNKNNFKEFKVKKGWGSGSEPEDLRVVGIIMDGQIDDGHASVGTYKFPGLVRYESSIDFQDHDFSQAPQDDPNQSWYNDDYAKGGKTKRYTQKDNIIRQFATKEGYAIIDDRGNEIESMLTLEDAKYIIKELNKKARGRNIGEKVRVSKIPYITSFSPLYDKELEIKDVKEFKEYGLIGDGKFYVVNYAGENYEIPGDMIEGYAKGGELMDADTEFEYGKGAKLQRCGLTEKSLFSFRDFLLRKKKFLEVGLKREGGLPVQDNTWAQYSLLDDILESLEFYSYDDYAKGGKLMDADTEFEYKRGGNIDKTDPEYIEYSRLSEKLSAGTITPKEKERLFILAFGEDYMKSKNKGKKRKYDESGKRVKDRDRDEYARGGKTGLKIVTVDRDPRIPMEDIEKMYNLKIIKSSDADFPEYDYDVLVGKEKDIKGFFEDYNIGDHMYGEIEDYARGGSFEKEKGQMYTFPRYSKYKGMSFGDEADILYGGDEEVRHQEARDWMEEMEEKYSGVKFKRLSLDEWLSEYRGDISAKDHEDGYMLAYGKIYAKGGNIPNLKVTAIKYNETRRGISYIAKTNVKGVEIVNDGMGGATFLEGSWKDIKPYNNLDEWDLEDLINDYEKVYAKGGKSGDNWIQDVTKEMEKDGTEGAFTKQAKRHKMTPIQFAKKVLKNPKKFSLKTRQRAQFVKNVNPEKFYEGGNISQVSKVGDPDYPNYEL